MKPTFIGIGSQRCATTWLYKMLTNYSAIKISKPKELNFFSNPIGKNIAQYLTYFDSAQEEGIMARGEISPAYARLGFNRIKLIKKLLPDLKIIFVMRDPIERHWSSCCYLLGAIENKQLDKISNLGFILIASRTRVLYYSDYYRTIMNWQTVFGKDAMLILLQESINKNPQEYLNKVIDHIQIETNGSLTIDDSILSRQINTTEGRSKQKKHLIPDEVRWYIAKKLLPTTRQLNDLFDGQFQEWVNHLESAIVTSRWHWHLKYFLVEYILAVPERILWSVIEVFRDVYLSILVNKYLKNNL